jgi:hypothetical protein
MSKGDINKKQAADRAEWEKRGISGIVTALNPDSKEITINTVTTKPMVVTLAQSAVLRRYAPNSIKFSDALISKFEDLKVGDQIKALGNRNADLSRYTAEQIVFGSFRTIAATVVETNLGQNIVVITDLTTNQRLQAQVIPDSTLRRVTPEVASMLSTRIQSSKSSASPPATAEKQPVQGPRDLQSIIEKLPLIKLSDLKPGDALILSCSSGDDPLRVTAVTLLSGVESIFKSSSNGGKAPDLGSWNLDLNPSIGVP